MNGAQYADLKVMDALQPLGSITGGIMEGLPNQPGFYPGGLTMILTNPPFGSKVTNAEILEDFASRDGLTKKNNKVITRVPQEVAFINRCLEFLCPGGKLAIVLPDGVLANTSTQDVRDWILRWAKLKAVVSIPQETFYSYGAGVKSSVLFLEKNLLGNKDVDENYSVYLAQIQNGSYERSNLSASENEIINFNEVNAVVEDFHQKLGWPA
jgi:type I restriction enzyme M protein